MCLFPQPAMPIYRHVVGGRACLKRGDHLTGPKVSETERPGERTLSVFKRRWCLCLQTRACHPCCHSFMWLASQAVAVFHTHARYLRRQACRSFPALQMQCKRCVPNEKSFGESAGVQGSLRDAAVTCGMRDLRTEQLLKEGAHRCWCHAPA